MNYAQEKAWSCLREDEKNSLFLQMSEGKSSWEAGTIMERSHYKYIEIRERSQKFFKMFTEFFEKHESIFRPDAPYKQVFMDYIEACIERRLTRRDSLVKTGDSSQLVYKRIRNPMLEHNMRKLIDSEDPWDKDTLALIIEFDRWNNHRILPKILQAPSAYKRRNNHKFKIYLRYLLEKFPPWAHEKLIERFRYKLSKNSKPRYWVALISKEKYKDNFGYYVFPIKRDEEGVREMTRFFIYVFDDQDTADSFGFMVSQYYCKTDTIPSGQKYWAEFRNIVEQAINYKQVNNIDFTVKTLDYAYNVPKSKKNNPDNDSEGIPRVEENLLNH
jgi:hypothetical protein